MKTWRPDTCECLMEEVYEGDKIVGMGQVLKKCSAHSGVEDSELYQVIMTNPDSEQYRKNYLGGFLKEKGIIKKSEDYEWSFEGEGKSRVLNAKVKGADLSNDDKNKIKDFTDNKFGQGKIKI